MKIVISGGGKIGSAIVRNLVMENHQVTVIDSDPEVIESVMSAYDVLGYTAQCTDWNALKAAGAEQADLYISAVDSDELNMLSCFAARKLGAKHTIARIRDDEHNTEDADAMWEELGLSLVINPERLTAQAIYDQIRFPSHIRADNFAGHNCIMTEMTVEEDSPLCGMALSDMRKAQKAQFLVCAVRHENRVLIPSGSYVLKEGDQILLIASREQMYKLLRNLSLIRRFTRSVILLGAGRVSYYLTKMLLGTDCDIKVIDRDRARCEEFTDRIEKEVMVICGNGVSRDLLEEEGILTADAFVSLTGQDELNLLMSFYAREMGVEKVIAQVKDREEVKLAEKLALPCIMSPGQITADRIVRYVRSLQSEEGSGVESFFRIMDDGAEVLSFAVTREFSHLDTPLRQLTFRRNVLVAAIIRGQKTLIPGGDDVIRAGDRVIVVAAGQHPSALSDIFDRV